MLEPLHVELERGIHEDPDDDARFEVYADWLVAQGSPRGQLAAVQLAREHEDTPELAAREAALLDEHAVMFRGELRTPFREGLRWLEDLCGVRYKGGFWRSLSFGGTPQELRLVVEHPSARLLHTLEIQHVEEHDEEFEAGIAALARCEPVLGGLRELVIGDMPEDGLEGPYFGLRSCANLGQVGQACPRLTTLRLLCANFNAGTETFPNLRWLDARMGASPDSLASLGKARFPRLEQLDLGFETSRKVVWASLKWPENALDELLGALDVAMPVLRRVRLWPMPYKLDHPVIQRFANLPRIEVCNWDDGTDDANGVYQLWE